MSVLFILIEIREIGYLYFLCVDWLNWLVALINLVSVAILFLLYVFVYIIPVRGSSRETYFLIITLKFQNHHRFVPKADSERASPSPSFFFLRVCF